MSLIEVKVGESVLIEDFLDPYCDVATRICSMGLNKGEVARVISNNFLSPVLLMINGVKVAVSKTEAKKIRVTKL